MLGVRVPLGLPQKVDYKMKKISTFIRDAKLEIEKVIFPTKVQIRQAFVSVILVVTVISIFLALVDWMMASIVSTVV